MIEIYGDLWLHRPADARVITTNGYVRNDGAAVMGRGCAKQAKDLFPGVEYSLGQALDRYGNHVSKIWTIHGKTPLYSFPVKHHWSQQASEQLIEQSANELVAIIDLHSQSVQQLNAIVLPRPGCGNGNLAWEIVKLIIEPILDNRFHVITHG